VLSVLRAACRDNSKVDLASRVVGAKVNETALHLSPPCYFTRYFHDGAHSVSCAASTAHSFVLQLPAQTGLPSQAEPTRVRHATGTA
jgi:hypothetical protein